MLPTDISFPRHREGCRNPETETRGGGERATHSRFLAQEMLAMPWHLWTCHYIHLCWCLLCWACWQRPCTHRSCCPVHPPPPQAAYPGTLVAMVKAISPRKTIPPQNQWNKCSSQTVGHYASVYNENNWIFVGTSPVRMCAMVNIAVEKSGRDYQQKKWQI